MTKNFCDIKMTRDSRRVKFAPEVAVFVSLLLTCTHIYGQSVPETANPSTPQTTTQSTLNTVPPVVPQPLYTPVIDQTDDGDGVPKQAPLTPNVVHETVSADEVFTVHLRPLFTTVVRLPEQVTSLAIGAPTLIAAEHDKSEPRLVFIKPTTHQKVDSNVVIALRSGRTLAIRVISDGDQGSTTPVDFVVDYGQPHSLMLDAPASDSTDQAPLPAGRSVPSSPATVTTPMQRPLNEPPTSQHDLHPGLSTVVTDSTPVATNDSPIPPPTRADAPSLLDALYQEQQAVAAPHYVTAAELARLYPENKSASPDLSASLGRSVQKGDSVAVSYSVLNRSGRWIEVLPPQLEFNNPSKGKKNGKVDKKHPEALAEQLPINDYRMSKSKLAPGERMDAAIQFMRPGFKFSKERLLLQIANASEVDTALLFPVPFVSADR
jgi:hypothetical protein